ncbi:DNA helicase [Aeromonas phage GomatiRiver_11]|nr:ATP-dependent DNA helicase [Aeromonas phage AhFM11]WKW84421.1 DNA helicase [Aeromonas phage GomatiRiver_11]
MKSFKRFLTEAMIGTFMSKIADCQTKEGLKELEKYYNKRSKEVELKDADDISIRDAIAGKMAEFEPEEEDKEEEEF